MKKIKCQILITEEESLLAKDVFSGNTNKLEEGTMFDHKIKVEGYCVLLDLWGLIDDELYPNLTLHVFPDGEDALIFDCYRDLDVNNMFQTYTLKYSDDLMFEITILLEK